MLAFGTRAWLPEAAVRVTGSPSTSVSVTVSGPVVESSSTEAMSPGTTRNTGLSLTGVTVTLTVAVALPPLPSPMV